MATLAIKIPRWDIEEETGYKPFTTFWQDFSIADTYGLQAIQDTFKRAFDAWKDNYKYLTELVLVLNHKIFHHYVEKGTEEENEKASLYNELVNTDPQTSQEWLNDHIRASLDYFFCDAEFQHQSELSSHFHDHGFSGTYDFPTLVINDMGDTSDDDMLEFKYEYINHKYYVTFLNRLKG